MAEERTLGVARARDLTDEEPSKEELQRRMEEARDSISHTVTEIKDTVVNQYQSVKDQINETLDWREHVRKRPVLWTAGALGVGVSVGYCIASTIKGESEQYDDYRLRNMKRVTPSGRSFSPSDRYYASHANEARDTPEPARTAAPEEPSGPGLIERFKETAAYDRLEKEVSSLGGRLVDELSKTATEVVLPMLLKKVTELIGIDLSEKEPAKEKRLASGSHAGGDDREVYGVRAAGASASGRSYEAQPGKADRASGGSALPRPSEAGA
ncbi:MAG: hypothetical protein ABI596_14290 [Pyrinomonadaceae bacterium]